VVHVRGADRVITTSRDGLHYIYIMYISEYMYTYIYRWRLLSEIWMRCIYAGLRGLIARLVMGCIFDLRLIIKIRPPCARCASMLQRVAACCSVSQRVAACCSVSQRVAVVCCTVVNCIVVCCSVLEGV